jgi:threonine synthase
MIYCNKCGKSYDDSSCILRCACGGSLKYQMNKKVTFPKKKIKSRPETIWRYREALPLSSDNNIVSLGEGMTPLILTEWEGKQVYFKLDYLCPTGSFKDRGSSFFISKLKEMNINKIIEDSSGNAGASMAAYCSRANMRCDVYVPDYTSADKVVQISMYGANVFKVHGNREDTAIAAEKAGKESDSYYACHNWSPYYPHGVKTVAFELWEQFNWQIPDNIVMPIGQGSLALGCGLGFNELLIAGEIKSLPRIYGVQVLNCAPLYHAFRKGLTEPEIIQKKETIAEGISSAIPAKGSTVLKRIRESKGKIVAISENKIWPNLKKLAKMGFYVEPSSATVTAGLSELIMSGEIKSNETTVVILTGFGLKATNKILELKNKD